MRRALRVQDNTPLSAAIQNAEEVIPVFCLREDPHYRTIRRQFLSGLVRDCDSNLRKAGSRLFIRSGRPEEEIPAAVQAWEADAVYAVRVYDRPSLQTDAKIAASLRNAGAEFVVFKDAVLFEGSEILSRTGNPYKVFTPYKNAWLLRLHDIPPVLPHVRVLKTPASLPGEISLDRFPGVDRAQEGFGETLAMKNLRAFANRKIRSYGVNRDFPAEEGTSRLSPFLANGAISIRTVFQATFGARASGGKSVRQNVDVFLNELVWREFYYQILHNFPGVLQGSFRTELNGVAWRNDPVKFDAWCNGNTGYPIVDAAMRQLNQEGWMHNRARMIAASFLTKDLHINWQWGEKYFFDHLIDADLASNNGGWQWTAGTGTDASPWFRIFNPVLQGEKFDPEGAYVLRYLPELAGVPKQWIHKPWMLPKHGKMKELRSVTAYPRPIVDHAVARAMSLTLYRSALGEVDPRTGKRRV
jgi:deoxyribodipyrimidine photo-lyase